MAIARVTHVYFAGSNPGLTVTSTPSFNAVTGNLIIVILRESGSGSVDFSGTPTDTAGNTYTLIGADSAQDPSMRCYYAKNITGNASNVVSFTELAQGDNFQWLWAGQYSGLDTTAPLDTHDEHDGAGGTTDLTSGSITTAQASELIVMGVSQNAFATYSAGTNYTLVDNIANGSSQNYGGVEEFITSSTQSGAQHITSGSTNQYTSVVAAFKAAGGGGGGRGLFRPPALSGVGVGGSFFRDPLQSAQT